MMRIGKLKKNIILYLFKANDESSNKKHLDLYYILISQKLSIFLT